MIDFRCPKCNRPVKGKEEVTFVGKLPSPPIKRCPNKECEAKIKLEDASNDGIECKYYGTL